MPEIKREPELDNRFIDGMPEFMATMEDNTKNLVSDGASIRSATESTSAYVNAINGKLRNMQTDVSDTAGAAERAANASEEIVRLLGGSVDTERLEVVAEQSFQQVDDSESSQLTAELNDALINCDFISIDLEVHSTGNIPFRDIYIYPAFYTQNREVDTHVWFSKEILKAGAIARPTEILSLLSCGLRLSWHKNIGTSILIMNHTYTIRSNTNDTSLAVVKVDRKWDVTIKALKIK